MTTEKLLKLMNQQHDFIEKLKTKQSINNVKQQITTKCRELLRSK